MATEVAIWDESFKAENDLSSQQYKFVELSAADQVDLIDNIRDVPIGVLQNKPAAGQAAQIRILGISKVVSDGSGTAIAANDFVGSNGAGVAIKKATNDYTIGGIALDPSTANGTIIRVLLPGVHFFRAAADA